MANDRLINMKEVLYLIPLSKSSIYRQIQEGTFPKQVRIGRSHIAFREAEVRAWIKSRLTPPTEGAGADE